MLSMDEYIYLHFGKLSIQVIFGSIARFNVDATDMEYTYTEPISNLYRVTQKCLCSTYYLLYVKKNLKKHYSDDET